MYEDYTTFYANIEDFNPVTFELEINQSLEILNNSFKLNKLSINVDKTKLMIYRKKR